MCSGSTSANALFRGTSPAAVTTILPMKYVTPTRNSQRAAGCAQRKSNTQLKTKLNAVLPKKTKKNTGIKTVILMDSSLQCPHAGTPWLVLRFSKTLT
jgi:hypothetical protein